MPRSWLSVRMINLLPRSQSSKDLFAWELPQALHSMHRILWTDLLPIPPPPPTPSRCRQCPAAYGRDSVWGCRLSYQNATLHHEEGVWCIICTEAFPTSSSGAWGPMQRVHRRGSQVMSECCTVGHSATLARAHAHMITGTI